MPRIPILKLGSTSESPPSQLRSYSPALPLEGLQLGIDNLRHDVWLSPSFTKAAGAHIARLIAKYGSVESVISAESATSLNAQRSMFSKVSSALSGKNSDLKPLLLD